MKLSTNILNCCVEKYRPGTLAEALRSGDIGCGTEESWHRTRADKAKSWHCRPHGRNNFVMVS